MEKQYDQILQHTKRKLNALNDNESSYWYMSMKASIILLQKSNEGVATKDLKNSCFRKKKQTIQFPTVLNISDFLKQNILACSHI